nr:hypothetical protein [Tanacetum cinerariifolium]
MFKLNVSQSVSPIFVLKTSYASNNVEKKTKRKRGNINSSKQHDKQVNKDVLHANRGFVHFLDLDTFSSVSSVEWKKKGSSNTSKVNLFSDNHSNSNKNVKRYSRKDLMSCNNSHLKDTRSAFVCNNSRNASCNARMNAYIDVNDLFVFDDVCLRKSHVSKMPFRKKHCASLNMHSRIKLNKSLPRIVSKWLLKVQSLAEPLAKWIPRVKRQIYKITKTSTHRDPFSNGYPKFVECIWLFYLLQIVQICLWIIDFGCSKHMTGNRALLMNFVEMFLGTVRFRNNYFVVIAGYGDVVGSMTIKNVYYVEDFLIDDRSSNLYTIALNEIASNSSNCLLAKASSSQSWLWLQRLSHLNFATSNNLVKNNLVRGLPKMKFKKYHLCSDCEQGKIHQKHHKSKMDFASNKLLYLLHNDLC